LDRRNALRMKSGLHKAVHINSSYMRPFVLISSFLFLACNNLSSDRNSVYKDTIGQMVVPDISVNVGIPDSSRSLGTVLYVWSVDFDNKTKTKNPKFKSEYLNVDTLIRGLNEMYPNIKLDKVRISNDTLFTKILDSEYLGERMGTSGAAQYLADVVINLTSIEKIKYVKIEFDEGSHACPGIWNARDFLDYRQIR
jgi:hypothetical protein